MVQPLILASGSAIRAELLRRANVPFEILPATVDESAIKASLLAEGASPRDIADALAEAKARKIASKRPEVLVLGCDQVLEFDGTVLSKPATADDAIVQIQGLRGKRHDLHSAAVVYEGATPLWRHVGHARMWMRDISDAYAHDYVERNWESIRTSVGGYKIEEEGVRLFSRIEGDHFTILGLPLLQLLPWLTARGTLPE